MKRLIYILTILTLVIGLGSFKRIKNKTELLIEQVKQKAATKYYEYGQQIGEKIIPPFDHHKPDTDNNKKRFKDFIKVGITSDIKNIYCYDEAIGIDATYMFSFNCNQKTSDKIIATHNLTLDINNRNVNLGDRYDFIWWDSNIIENLVRYTWSDSRGFYKHYWYDDTDQRAYFLDFNM